jgi:UDP-N-acetyl-D-mannosaminuronic acid dehydrogenase
VVCTDEHVRSDPTLLSMDEVLDRADVLVIGAPHAAYAQLDTTRPVIDVWNLLGRGVRV